MAPPLSLAFSPQPMSVPLLVTCKKIDILNEITLNLRTAQRMVEQGSYATDTCRVGLVQTSPSLNQPWSKGTVLNQWLRRRHFMLPN